MSTLDTPLTKQEVLQSLLHVQLVEDQGSDEPTPHQRRTTRRLHRNQSQRKVGSPAHGARATTPSPRKAHRPNTQRSATSEWPRLRQRISPPAQPLKPRPLHRRGQRRRGSHPKTQVTQCEEPRTGSCNSTRTPASLPRTPGCVSAGFIPQELSRQRVLRESGNCSYRERTMRGGHSES